MDETAREVTAIRYNGKTKKSYVPEGYSDRETFLKEMREEYRLDLQADDHNRREAIDDKKFTAGEQWDPEVLRHRQGLPNLVINTIPQFTAQLVGDWRQSRNAVKVLPAEDGDVEVASVRGDLIRSIEYKSRASRVYDSAFESMVQCGDGAFRISVCYANDDVFEQEIGIKPVDDALSVVWDRMSIDPTGRDARHVFVDDSIPLREFNQKWPGNQPSELSENTRNACVTDGWIEESMVRVTEYWRMIERDRLLGLFEDGSVHVIEGDKMDELVEAHGGIVKSRISPCMYAQMHLVTGWSILDGPYEYKLNRVPVVRMTGRIVNINGKRIRTGLVRPMKDPARLRNFWRSIAAEQLGYAPKAQWIAPESAVEGREEIFRKAHLSRDPLIVYNDGAEHPPERVEPPAPQMALLNEAQVNTQDMKDVTGIHDASLGIKSNETSGRAIMARQKEGDVAAITFYDNGNAAILEAGDIINQLIPVIYDSTRIVRIIGEDEAPKLIKINDKGNPDSPDLSVGKYDVALTSGTSYTTRRAEAAQAMMEAVQVWPNLIGIAGDIIAKAQDWPGAEKLAERLKKTIPQELLDEDERDPNAVPQIDPQQIQEMQMQLQTLQQENMQMKMDREIDMEKLEIDRYNAETQRIRALSDHEVDGNQMEMDAIQAILDESARREEIDAQKDAQESESESDE